MFFFITQLENKEQNDKKTENITIRYEGYNMKQKQKGSWDVQFPHRASPCTIKNQT